MEAEVVHEDQTEVSFTEMGTLSHWDGRVSGWRNGQSLTLGWMSEWAENWAVSNAGVDELVDREMGSLTLGWIN